VGKEEGQGFAVESRSDETLSEWNERTTRRVRNPCGVRRSGGAGIRTLKSVRTPVFETDLSCPSEYLQVPKSPSQSDLHSGAFLLSPPESL